MEWIESNKFDFNNFFDVEKLLMYFKGKDFKYFDKKKIKFVFEKYIESLIEIVDKLDEFGVELFYFNYFLKVFFELGNLKFKDVSFDDFLNDFMNCIY